MKCYASAILLFAFSYSVHAQVKIGNNPLTLNANSILELETTNKGLVLPRVSLTNVNLATPLSATVLEGTFVYNTNASATGGSGTGLYYWTGSKWQYIVTSANTNAWLLTGNSGTSASTNFLGTTDNVGVSFRTNNIRRMLLDTSGGLAIGATTFDTDDPERLLVNYGTTTSHTIANFSGSINDYFQINLRNTSSGRNASTDYVATADNGTDSTYYIDMGINSSTYAPGVENFGGPNDGYLYANSRNLLIGTQASGSDLIFMVGGNTIGAATALRINGSTGNVIVGKGEGTASTTGNVLRGPNANATGNANGGTLTIQGGRGAGTGNGGSVNINGGNAIGTGSLGSVNINAGVNFATNINTGTASQNVTVGGNANNILFPKFSTVGGMYYTSVNTGQLSTTGSNMTWDSINNRLGIGITNPGYKLSVVSAANPLYLYGVQATSTFTNDSILTINAGIVKKAPYSSLPSGGSGSGWLLTGNSITAGQFLGTTNAQPLILKALNNQMAYFDGNLQSLALGFGAVNNTSDHNVAIGYNASTNNQYALALGYNASASGVRSVAIGNGASGTNAAGAEAVAIGFGSYAKADQAVALGYQANGTGQFGVAIGYNPTASGSQSVAIGYQAQATQQYSNAIGYQAQATGLQSTAIGYNAQTAQSNTILLGNAAANNLVVGIGTATPTAKLHIVSAGDAKPLILQGLPTGAASDNFLTINSTTGVVNSISAATINGTFWNLTGNTATSSSYLGTNNAQPLQFKYNSTSSGILDGSGNAAFGVGYITAGSNNTAIGNSANASNSATAVGAGAIANAVNNTAIGNGATANNSDRETAIGAAAVANAQYNTALGYNAQAISNAQAIALGYNSTANAFQSLAIGPGSQAISNAQTIAIGVSAVANSQYSTAIGYQAQAISNSQATALGSTAKANSQYSTAVGYNAQAITNSFSSAFGTNSIASGQYTNALGAESDATTQYATAVGYNAQAVTAAQTTALGSNASASGTGSTAIGYNAQISQANAILLGDAVNTSLTVGIGTAAPSNKLSVLAASNPLYLSGVQATSTFTTDSLLTINAGVVKKAPYISLAGASWSLLGNSGTTAGTNFIGTTDNIDFVTKTNGTERMRVSAAGNVGIGTNAPIAPLDFGNAALGNKLFLWQGTTTNSYGFGIQNTLLQMFSATGADIAFGTGASGSFTEAMRIKGSGRVGIGTNAPASDLTINQSAGSGSSKGFTFTGNSIGGTNSGTGFLMSLGYNTTGNKQLWLGDADYAGNASGSFGRFVSTGTAFPVFDAVSGDNASRRYLALGVAGDANSGVIFGGDGTNTSPGSQVWDNGNMTIGAGYKSAVAPANGLLVQGNVGIGTSSPSATAKLDVAGAYKLGTAGTVHKTAESFTGTANVSVPQQFNTASVFGITVLQLNAGTNYADITFTLPNALSGTQGSVVVSPAFDLPAGVSIAYARIVSSTQVKARLYNAGTGSQIVNGSFNITVTEF